MTVYTPKKVLQLKIYRSCYVYNKWTLKTIFKKKEVYKKVCWQNWTQHKSYERRDYEITTLI